MENIIVEYVRMKILVERDFIETILVTLEACQGDIYAPPQAMRQINVAVKQLQKILQNNPESTFPVYRSCHICGKTIYLTDPHKCNGPYKRY